MNVPYESVLFALLVAGVLGCGGRIGAGDDGGAADGGLSDGGGGGDGGGWTKCSSPSGILICGGPNQCGADCSQCAPPQLGTDGGALRVCQGGTDPEPPDGNEWQCPDGALNGTIWECPSCSPLTGCVKEELAQLYALNGRPDLALYSDRSAYTGAPIPPPPTTCPPVSAGLNLCGGACGACPDPAHQTCTGRSPLHPVSMCQDTYNTTDALPCQRGDGGFCSTLDNGRMCLTYTLDSASQATADHYSMCVASSICLAAAQSYPGGAFCTTGMAQ